MKARPRILFVDDEINVLEALGRAFRAWHGDWDMVFESDVTKALAEQRRLPFQVAVVDIRMPVMSGLELISTMNDIAPATLAIVLTGATDIGTAAQAINEANVFRFYTKPCTADILAKAIDQALAELARRQATSAIAPPGAMFSMATLDRLPTAVIVVDAQPRVLFTNRQGAAVLAMRDGLSVGSDGLCRTSRPADTIEMVRLIKAAIVGGTPAKAMSLDRQKADRPLSLVIASLPEQRGSEAAAVLLVSDPDQRSMPSVDTVSRLFDLTEAEARLALALSEGHRIEDAAERLGITISSARTYLKRVFSKTDVTRQAELVRLILAAPTLTPADAANDPLRPH
jgi:DNA-binding NarL/FixJ family response regulator